MVENAFYSSKGYLRYSITDTGLSKLIVEVDKDIAYLAKALIPKYHNVQRQRFPPHISIVRNEGLIKHPKWGLYEGKLVSFEYGTYVFNNAIYYWLRVKSQELIDIRLELDLQEHSLYSKPPDGTRWFHITVGNKKT